MVDFAHLHVHSHFTLLECTVTSKALMSEAERLGLRGVALTDRANMCAAYEFSVGAKNASFEPLIGCQVNIAPLGIAEKTPDMLQLVLLACSDTGYNNLCELTSLGWLDGFYFEARIDIDLLRRYQEGLICLTGAGPDGFLNRHILSGAQEESERQGQILKDIFGDRVYVELTRHQTEHDDQLIAGNIAVCEKVGIEPVATNWVHYLKRDDYYAHDVQSAVKKVTTLSDPRRRRMPSEEFYLKSPEEMAELFADIPQAISNTMVIMERCKGTQIPTGTYHLPVFECPDGLDEGHYLRRLCTEGMYKRYGDQPSDEVLERLNFEMDVIINMGFPAYFLIVADFINWAKDNDIPVGPGRGSAAGSLVAYCMGITDLCPLRYDLLFERFLNPGRKSMPDIDIDFCKDGRGRVIEYVADKYGHEAVTQIMTLGSMKARMAIKDVSRAYEWTPEEAQDLANLVPEDPSGKHTIPVCLGIKDIKGTFDPSEKMVTRYKGDDRTKQVLDTAMQLENLGRSHGVHACGVIIAPGPVHTFVPVISVKGKPATAYNMVQVEECGLLKMDFLGLRTMSILKKAADITKAVHGVDIDYPNVPLDDTKTFELLGEGATLGVFQCESSGFQELIKLLQPDRFEDMIALVALYRPGPLMAGMHTDYCERKHGRQAVSYPHPVLENILQETFGLFIYQEQVMNISRQLCGFSPSEADDLRKAMGKKKIDVLNKLKEKFINGAWELNQFDKAKCEAMWNDILGFASYCFNKSHSACYGLIAYWTAYMKANHFEAFMTANLIYEMGNKDKMTMFVQELNSRGVNVLPPDVNESGWEFTYTGEAIRFGFGGIKGVGNGAAEFLMEDRETGGPYTSLYDLCARLDTRKVNKRVIDSLIKVGAMDSLHNNRQALCHTVDKAFDRGSRLNKAESLAQESLFAAFEQQKDFAAQTQGYPDIDDWSENERLQFEKNLTGYWMSSHPLREHEASLSLHTTHVSKDMIARPHGMVMLAAVIIGKRDIKTKTGKRMCVLQVEDLHGGFEAVLFPGRQNRRGDMEPGAYERFAHDCEVDMVVLLKGKVDQRRRQRAQRNQDGNDDDPEAVEEVVEDMPSLLVEEVIPANMLNERLTKAIVLHVDAERCKDQDLAATEELFKDHSGTCPVKVLMQTPNDVLLTVQMSDRWCVHPSTRLIHDLRGIWGKACVEPMMEQVQ